MALSAALGTAGLRPGICTSTSRPGGPYTGQIIYETDTGYLRVWDGSAWDYFSKSQDATTNLPISDIGKAWTDFSSSVVLWQGSNLTTTVQYAKYSQINKTVFVNAMITAGSAGTATNFIEIRSLPVTAANADGIGGSFMYLDQGVQFYAGTVVGRTTTSVGFYFQGGVNLFGTGVTVASTDYIRAFISYEAA